MLVIKAKNGSISRRHDTKGKRPMSLISSPKSVVELNSFFLCFIRLKDTTKMLTMGPDYPQNNQT